MDTYSLMREFADSWFLLVMFVFFVGVAIWAFWPGQAQARRDASMIPFRNDRPAGACSKNDKDRSCRNLDLKE